MAIQRNENAHTRIDTYIHVYRIRRCEPANRPTHATVVFCMHKHKHTRVRMAPTYYYYGYTRGIYLVVEPHDQGATIARTSRG